MDDFNDDDMMLNNIVTSKPSAKTTTNKSQLKKQKYTQKIKEKRKKSLGKSGPAYGNSSIINSMSQGMNSRKQEVKNNQSLNKQNSQLNRVNKQGQQNQKQPNTQRPNGQTQGRRPRLQIKPKRQNDRSLKKVSFDRRRQQSKGTIDLKNSKAKMEQIQQILPQKDLSQIQKLDKAPVQQLHLHKSLLDSLKQNDINKLTQIQTLSYVSVFKRKDSIIKAATGSGKTLAYLIPLINQTIQHKYVTKRDDGTSILVICPTRQLCIQAQKQAMRCLKRLPFMVTGCLVGGEQTNHQKSRIRKGIPLMFATPGRLLYHLQNTQSFSLDKIKTIVFQQADRTLDMGFQSTVNDILQMLEKKLDLHVIQKILVSAHFNQKVQGLIKNLMMDSCQYIGFDKKKTHQTQIKVQAYQQKMNTINEDQDSDVHQIRPQQQSDGEDNQHQHQPLHQEQINTSSNLKQQYVLITQQQKIPFTLSYISVLPMSKIMIFVSTISQVQYLDYLINNMVYRNSNGQMTQQKIQKRTVYKIHGDLDQKLRTNTYFAFRKEKYAIMISTEVASRGLDFPDLSHIILFDIPPTITDYGNRIGRSGRFNSTGVSLLLLHYQQSDYAQKIRYYNKDKPLDNINKDLIYENFQNFLRKLNIRDSTLHYVEGIVRSMVKDDDEKYQLARKAYVSMLRAYARLTDKHIFHVKKLNLKMLSRTFGLNSAQADRGYNPMAKQSHFQTIRKKRKVQSLKSLQVSQYL